VLVAVGAPVPVTLDNERIDMIRATWNATVIAESDDTVIVDGNHYFAPDTVNQTYLVPSETTSVCGWKGVAGYYSLHVDGSVNSDAAWCYADPLDGAKEIAGRIAFWRGVHIDDDGLTPPTT